MDWVYAAPLDINGGSYLRLILQAKRAQYATLASGGYWFYQHLDHDNGQQAQTLTGYAATSPDGLATLPLYIFYHPTSALVPAIRSQPAVDGINIVFASKVAPAVKGGCGRMKKRVNYWRNDFMPLSDLLCWPAVVEAPAPPPADATEFLIGPSTAFLGNVTGSYHPDLVARRLRERRSSRPQSASAGMDIPESLRIESVQGLPEDVRRAIDATATLDDRKRLTRPRIILATRLTRDSPSFRVVEERTRPPG